MSKQKINISKILSHCAVGTKLYSPVIGDVSLVEVYSSDSGSDMFLVRGQNELCRNIDLEFCPNGHFFYATPDAECLIFPSREMRDWSKFAWKKGDVLTGPGVVTIFVKFCGDNYDTFIGRDYIDGIDKIEAFDSEHKVIDFNRETEENAQKIIKYIENKFGAKLNRETLELEMSYKQYKDNASNPSIPCLLKPFDKVLVRDWENQNWHCNIYSHYSCNSHYPHVCADGGYKFCIPYEGNEHLLGTDKGVDEQEGGKQ